jgi:hypothetical protein
MDSFGCIRFQWVGFWFLITSQKAIPWCFIHQCERIPKSHRYQSVQFVWRYNMQKGRLKGTLAVRSPRNQQEKITIQSSVPTSRPRIQPDPATCLLYAPPPLTELSNSELPNPLRSWFNLIISDEVYLRRLDCLCKNTVYLLNNRLMLGPSTSEIMTLLKCDITYHVSIECMTW